MDNFLEKDSIDPRIDRKYRRIIDAAIAHFLLKDSIHRFFKFGTNCEFHISIPKKIAKIARLYKAKLPGLIHMVFCFLILDDMNILYTHVLSLIVKKMKIAEHEKAEYKPKKEYVTYRLELGIPPETVKKMATYYQDLVTKGECTVSCEPDGVKNFKSEAK